MVYVLVLLGWLGLLACLTKPGPYWYQNGLSLLNTVVQLYNCTAVVLVGKKCKRNRPDWIEHVHSVPPVSDLQYSHKHLHLPTVPIYN